MASTDAGTPPAGDGRPPSEPKPRRGLRDSTLGRLALLALVLGVALIAARTCASAGRDITSDEAKQIAIEHASFVPCADDRCKRAQFVQRGIPPRPFWVVGLAERLDANGQPTRTESFLVDAATGEVFQP
jgi:hypothetical protein